MCISHRHMSNGNRVIVGCMQPPCDEDIHKTGSQKLFHYIHLHHSACASTARICIHCVHSSTLMADYKLLSSSSRCFSCSSPARLQLQVYIQRGEILKSYNPNLKLQITIT